MSPRNQETVFGVSIGAWILWTLTITAAVIAAYISLRIAPLGDKTNGESSTLYKLVGYGGGTTNCAIEIAVDGDITETWAGGTDAFDKVWTDRAGYSYT